MDKRSGQSLCSCTSMSRVAPQYKVLLRSPGCSSWRTLETICSFYALNPTIKGTCRSHIIELMRSSASGREVVFPCVGGVARLAQGMQLVRDLNFYHPIPLHFHSFKTLGPLQVFPPATILWDGQDTEPSSHLWRPRSLPHARPSAGLRGVWDTLQHTKSGKTEY